MEFLDELAGFVQQAICISNICMGRELDTDSVNTVSGSRWPVENVLPPKDTRLRSHSVVE